MDELKNYAEFSFVNPILLDIFGNYMENSVLASFVAQDGKMNFKFRVEPPVEPPKNCEDILGLLYSMLESNSDTAEGAAYSAKKNEIMRETIFKLSKVLDGFGVIKMVLHTTENAKDDPDSEVTNHTEFSLSRTRNDNK